MSSVIGGEGLAAAEPEVGGGVGAADGVPEAVFFIAAIFAAISALFWAMRASAESYYRMNLVDCVRNEIG